MVNKDEPTRLVNLYCSIMSMENWMWVEVERPTTELTGEGSRKVP